LTTRAFNLLYNCYISLLKQTRMICNQLYYRCKYQHKLKIKSVIYTCVYIHIYMYIYMSAVGFKTRLEICSFIKPLKINGTQLIVTSTRHLLNRFATLQVLNMVFTDENDLTLEIPLNCKNDVVYSKKKSNIPPVTLYYEQNRFSTKK